CLVLREHGGRARRGGGQSAVSLHARAGIGIPLEPAAVGAQEPPVRSVGMATVAPWAGYTVGARTPVIPDHLILNSSGISTNCLTRRPSASAGRNRHSESARRTDSTNSSSVART